MSQEQRDKDGVLDSREAGRFLRNILDDKGWQIQQLAEKTTVPDPDYLSNLLSGRINVGKSKHFPSIAKALGLNAEDIEYINPNLIVQVVDTDKSRYAGGSPIPPVVPWRETTITIPAELQRMADNNSDKFPQLAEERILRMLAAPRAHGGMDGMPQTEADWLDYWLDNRRWYK